jgi:hypothetical protein
MGTALQRIRRLLSNNLECFRKLYLAREAYNSPKADHVQQHANKQLLEFPKDYKTAMPAHQPPIVCRDIHLPAPAP